jgi:CheY-like chemotaxis protein
MLKFDAADILLAEDSDADAEMTARAFRRGHIDGLLTRVYDGVEAIDFVFRTGAFAARPEGRPRLVLLDLKMPRMGGVEVLRRLKADPASRTIPVVMLTSSAEDRDIAACYELGVNSYLVKPVDSAEFTDVVYRAGLYWAALNRVPT